MSLAKFRNPTLAEKFEAREAERLAALEVQELEEESVKTATKPKKVGKIKSKKKK